MKSASSSSARAPTKLGHALDWGVLLDYDYAQAIEENNLAKTVRTVEVAISSAS